MPDWDAIGEAADLELGPASVETGGSISSAYRVDSGRGQVFVKVEAAGALDRLAAEADGLAALAASGTVRVPRVLAQGIASGQAFLVIEYIERGRAPAAAALLGTQLAAMHRDTEDMFGWHRDNFIGSTPQPNSRESDWVVFLREHRLGFQLKLAAGNGYHPGKENAARLLEQLGDFYTGYQPQAALLHGDLWGGNWFADIEGAPVIFDPAVYRGDREADLAMTELFGGFGKDFYAAYEAAWPLDAGYRVRRDLHKLYHVLNHLNIFGGGYLGQAESLVSRLIAEL